MAFLLLFGCAAGIISITCATLAFSKRYFAWSYDRQRQRRLGDPFPIERKQLRAAHFSVEESQAQLQILIRNNARPAVIQAAQQSVVHAIFFETFTKTKSMDEK